MLIDEEWKEDRFIPNRWKTSYCKDYEHRECEINYNKWSENFSPKPFVPPPPLCSCLCHKEK